MAGNNRARLDFYKKQKGHYDVYQKYKDYYDRARALLDEDTRAGAFFKEGINAGLKTMEKLLGVSVSSHWSLKLINVQIDKLVEALTASITLENARKKHHEAVDIAKKIKLSAKRVTDDYSLKRTKLERDIKAKLKGLHHYFESMNYHGMGVHKTKKSLQNEINQAKTIMRGYMVKTAAERNRAKIYAREMVMFYTVCATGGKRVEALMAKYQGKLEKMEKGGIFSKVKARQEKQLREIDQLRASLGEISKTWFAPVATAKETIKMVEQHAEWWTFFADLCSVSNILTYNTNYLLPWELATKKIWKSLK